MGNAGYRLSGDDEDEVNHAVTGQQQQQLRERDSLMMPLSVDIVPDLNENAADSTDSSNTDGDSGPLTEQLSHIFDPALLRVAAVKLKDETAVDVVQQHVVELLSWLENGLARNEEVVTLAQFSDFMMNRHVDRDECIAAFQKFDVEGNGTADISPMLEAVKKMNNNTYIQEELSYVIETLQECSLTPGFIDVFNDDKCSIGRHGDRLLNFLQRNRSPVTALPFIPLDGFNNAVSLRTLVLKNVLKKVSERVVESTADDLLTADEELRPIVQMKCCQVVELSSNSNDVNNLFDENTSTYWQSDGSARSHWIRLWMKPNVVLKRLSLYVSPTDKSYMPNTITVAVGKVPKPLTEVKVINVPSHMKGFIVLLENVQTFHRVVQINIKRCQSDGCDTRIRAIKIQGLRVVKDPGFSVLDASVIWYLKILASTVTACQTVVPQLRDSLTLHTRDALLHIPPLCLSQASSERPKFLTKHVLKEVESFLANLQSSNDADGGSLCGEVAEIILSFSLSCGNVPAVLNILQKIIEYNQMIPCKPLFLRMVTVRDLFWRKSLNPLALRFVGGDAKLKLTNSPHDKNTYSSEFTNFQTESGVIKLNLFFKPERAAQLTRIQIKVEKGGRGPRYGFVFVYNDKYDLFDDEFDLSRNLERFDHVTPAAALLSDGEPVNEAGDVPSACFKMEDDWDETEVILEDFPIGKYVLLRFMEPRQTGVESLGVNSVKFYGCGQRSEDVYPFNKATLRELPESVSPYQISCCVLTFLCDIAQEQCSKKGQFYRTQSNQWLDVNDVTMELMWSLYNTKTNWSCSEIEQCRLLTLQLLHNLLPQMTGSKQDESESSQLLFQHLCSVIDNSSNSLASEGTSTSLASDGATSSLASEGTATSIASEGTSTSVASETTTTSLASESTTTSLTSDSTSTSLTSESTTTSLASESTTTSLTSDSTSTSLAGESATTSLISDGATTSLASDGATTSVASESKLVAISRNIIKNGIAVFFPDKEARRKQLFLLMENITLEECQRLPSVELIIQSLCQFYSHIDPSGLLNLPKGVGITKFNSEHVISIMDTLWSVAGSEFTATLKQTVTKQPPAESSHLVKLISSLQMSFIAWCRHQLEADKINQTDKEYIQTIFIQYLSMIISRALEALQQLSDLELDSESLSLKIEFLSASFLSLLVRHLLLSLVIMHKLFTSKNLVAVSDRLLLLVEKTKHLLNVCNQLNVLEKNAENSSSFTNLFTWNIESEHNYKGPDHVTQTFFYPGTSVFLVEFDPQCELYTALVDDYLEFTDSRGNKQRFEKKVGSENWTECVHFHGPHLRFLFQADSHGSEWGYKFKVTAKGSPDIHMPWLVDLYMTSIKVLGQLSGAALDSRKVLPKSTVVQEEHESREQAILRSDLWTTLFRAGDKTGTIERSLSGKYEADTAEGLVHGFLSNLIAKTDSQLANKLLTKCIEYCHSSSAGGVQLDEMVHSTFAALVWHTQPLREEVTKYLEKEGDVELSEGIYHAFRMADGLRNHMIELRQFMRLEAEKGSTQDVDIQVDKFKSKARFLMRFAGLTKIPVRSENRTKSNKNASSRKRKLSLLLDRQMSRSVSHDSEKYASFRLVMDFIKDPVWSVELVEMLLKQRTEHAVAVNSTFKLIYTFFKLVTDSTQHFFQVPVVLFMQQFLSYESHFSTHFIDGLEGCGLELESKVRHSFYSIIRFITGEIQTFKHNIISPNSVVTSVFEYMQACLLHLLDIKWQPNDLSFLVEMKLPQLLLNVAKSNLTNKTTYDEEAELRDYEQHMMWYEQSKKEENFQAWYRTISSDQKKSFDLFMARFCELLDVEIACDGCNVSLPGRRYRCLECQDIDLCAPCFSDDVNIPGGHTKDHDVVHLMYGCDGCRAFIVGTRIHCADCGDYDLCLGCYTKGNYKSMHKDSHEVTKFPMVTLRSSKKSVITLQSYIHEHSWLLFSSLALSTSYSIYNQQLDTDYLRSAATLQQQCIELISAYLNTFYFKEETLMNSLTSDPELIMKQEVAFAINHQERIIGLIGALIPSAYNSQIPIDENGFKFHNEEFLSQLFTVVHRDTEHDIKTEHLALALLGQLLLKDYTESKVCDQAVESVTKQPLPSTTIADMDGYRTIDFLFSYGAKRLAFTGLQWAYSVAVILQQLVNKPGWHDVLLKYMYTHTINSNPADQVIDPTMIFSMFILAGFPNVLTIGTHVKYSKFIYGIDANDGVILKRYPNRLTDIIDKQSRKKQTVKDKHVESCNIYDHMINDEQVNSLIELIQTYVNRIKSGEVVCVEAMWVLALALKALLQSMVYSDTKSLCKMQLIQSVVYLASFGTGFSNQIMLKDLEVLSLMLYSRKNTMSKTSKTQGAKGGSTSTGASEKKSTVKELTKPELDELTQKFLRMQDMNLDDIDDEQFDGQREQAKAYVVRLQMIEAMTDKATGIYETLQKTLVKENSDKTLDTGLKPFTAQGSHDKKSEVMEEAEDELFENCQQLVAVPDNDIYNDSLRQRHLNSFYLLEQAVDKYGKTPPPPEYLIKTNKAIAILYAREVLMKLLSDWPSAGDSLITAQLLGCSNESQIPCLIDMLSRTDSKHSIQKLVSNLIKNCEPACVIAITTTACHFMEDEYLLKICESQHPFTSACKISSYIHIPGATSLHVKFDQRCMTEEASLTLATSEDLTKHCKKLRGSKNSTNGFTWQELQFPGDTLYYEFDARSKLKNWGYRFTVSGDQLDRLDTGHRIIHSVLNQPNIQKLLPMESKAEKEWHRWLWLSMVNVVCRQQGSFRLKAIQLLLDILRMHQKQLEEGEKKLIINLSYLKPIWSLYVKMTSVVLEAGKLSSSLSRALTELFYVAEELALMCGIEVWYTASVRLQSEWETILKEGILNVLSVKKEMKIELISGEKTG
ncbi:zinc finger ZZ-type and EF-hand domain-containing protein 1-like [Tubulanus polymorphus]|uniref:zinc finger ZZ-type and EF-hand domain-containing protein 1-like n=1 Tax=Tubulanus polymorphus TaxID=672921 RepID=UPI003DA397FE